MGIKCRDSSQGIPQELIIDTNTLDMVAAPPWTISRKIYSSFLYLNTFIFVNAFIILKFKTSILQALYYKNGSFKYIAMYLNDRYA